MSHGIDLSFLDEVNFEKYLHPKEPEFADDPKWIFYQYLYAYKEESSSANFANVVLYGWVMIETYVNWLFVETLDVGRGEYGLDEEKAKNHQDLVEMLEARNFEAKITHLKKRNIITSKQHKDVQSFQKERNKLFHGASKNLTFEKIRDPNEQVKWVKSSKIAFDAVFEALLDYYDTYEDQI